MVSKRAKQADLSTISASYQCDVFTCGWVLGICYSKASRTDKRTTLVYLDYLADDSEAEIVSAMGNILGFKPPQSRQ